MSEHSVEEEFTRRGEPIYFPVSYAIEAEEIRLGVVLIDGVPTICDQHGRTVHGLESWRYGMEDDHTLTLVISPTPEAWDEMARIVEEHAKSIRENAGPHFVYLLWQLDDNSTPRDLMGIFSDRDTAESYRRLGDSRRKCVVDEVEVDEILRRKPDQD
jgi:hypothetical protein